MAVNVEITRQLGDFNWISDSAAMRGASESWAHPAAAKA